MLESMVDMKVPSAMVAKTGHGARVGGEGGVTAAR
jgi:hypothetical protein